MASDELEINPAALGGAAAIIAGHAAQVGSAAGCLCGSAELAGAAAAAMHGAFDGYCAALSQRLSAASAALVGAAGSFTAMEDTNGQMLGAVAPGGGAAGGKV